MAKDDYDVIACRILLYLYACFKRKQSYSETKFRKTALRGIKNEDHLTDILRLMQSEELIDGVVVEKTWGTDYIMLSELSDLEITARGIRYLQENGKMKQIMTSFVETSDIMAALIRILEIAL